MKKSLLCAVLFTLTSGLALSAPFTLKVPEQNTIELKKTPQTIAVYDLSILDTLNALGIEAKLFPKPPLAVI